MIFACYYYISLAVGESHELESLSDQSETSTSSDDVTDPVPKLSEEDAFSVSTTAEYAALETPIRHAIAGGKPEKVVPTSNTVTRSRSSVARIQHPEPQHLIDQRPRQRNTIFRQHRRKNGKTRRVEEQRVTVNEPLDAYTHVSHHESATSREIQVLLHHFDSLMPARCALPPLGGRCDQQNQRWYFDHVDNACKTFIFGGCEGNNNNYASLRECQAICQMKKMVDEKGKPQCACVSHIPYHCFPDSLLLIL